MVSVDTQTHSTKAAANPDFSEFEKLLEEYEAAHSPKEGEIVKGVVIEISKDYVTVDIGYKSEGQIPVEEFADPHGNIPLKVGDTIDVYLEESENEHGQIVLSKEKADKLKIWDEINEAVERDELVNGTITGRVKGGLTVDIGVKAFLPGSPGRPAPRAQPREVHRRGLRLQSHQVQQEARQHRAEPPRAAREGARRAEVPHPREARGRSGDDRRGEEHHGLRLLRGPRRHRRPAPHHRHVLGPHQPPERDVRGRR
jgi:DNA-directed RNA polymerase subunit E'/Rpb7